MHVYSQLQKWFISVRQISGRISTLTHSYGAQPSKNLWINHFLRTAFFRVITRRVVVISYRIFGTTYQSQPRDSKSLFYFGFLNPEDGTYRLSRNVGKNYLKLLRNKLEGRWSQLLRGGSLISLTISSPSHPNIWISFRLYSLQESGLNCREIWGSWSGVF